MKSMHILIKCACSINNVLLFPLKYMLAENESRVIISTLSDLDCKSHCCSLGPYCCSLGEYKISFVFVSYSCCFSLYAV